MECIDEETGQIRTRANTAMEELQQLNQSIYNSLPNFRGVPTAPGEIAKDQAIVEGQNGKGIGSMQTCSC
ncbi:hypothetical protein COOONC_08450 [Cooperia oncophora]